MKIANSILMYRVDDHIYPPGGKLTRWQHNLQLHYTYSGQTEICVDGKSWIQNPGEICLLLPAHQETFNYSRSEPTHHGFCTAAGAILSTEQRHCYEQLPHHIKMSPRIRDLTDRAKALYEEHTATAYNLYNRTAEMIFAEYFYTVGLPATPGTDFLSPLQRALDFINAHYAEPCTLSRLAENSFVSQTHLIRLFKQHLKMPPIRYLWRVRLQQAVEILLSTDLNATEIAFRCGFVSSDHFFRLFKQTYLMPPGHYRKVFRNRLPQNTSV